MNSFLSWDLNTPGSRTEECSKKLELVVFTISQSIILSDSVLAIFTRRAMNTLSASWNHFNHSHQRP